MHCFIGLPLLVDCIVESVLPRLARQTCYGRYQKVGAQLAQDEIGQDVELHSQGLRGTSIDSIHWHQKP